MIRLNAGEPHLRLTEFAERSADDSLLGKYLIFSHATPFARVAWHTHELRVPTKKSRPMDQLDSHLSTNSTQ